MYCANCGRKADEEANFCAWCGQALPEPDATARINQAVSTFESGNIGEALESLKGEVERAERQGDDVGDVKWRAAFWPKS